MSPFFSSDPNQLNTLLYWVRRKHMKNKVYTNGKYQIVELEFTRPWDGPGEYKTKEGFSVLVDHCVSNKEGKNYVIVLSCFYSGDNTPFEGSENQVIRRVARYKGTVQRFWTEVNRDKERMQELIQSQKEEVNEKVINGLRKMDWRRLYTTAFIVNVWEVMPEDLKPYIVYSFFHILQQTFPKKTLDLGEYICILLDLGDYLEKIEADTF
jgi:hypothetical protein